MAAHRPILKPSLRTKVLVPVYGVMMMMLLATVFIVSSRFQRQTEANSRAQLETAKARIRQNQEQHRVYLQRRFESLVREPVYRAAFLKLDPNTTRDQLERMFDSEELTNESVVFAFYTPQKSSTPANLPPIVQRLARPVSAAALAEACRLAVERSLQGEPAFDTIVVDNQLFHVVVIPVTNHGEVV